MGKSSKKIWYSSWTRLFCSDNRRIHEQTEHYWNEPLEKQLDEFLRLLVKIFERIFGKSSGEIPWRIFKEFLKQILDAKFLKAIHKENRLKKSLEKFLNESNFWRFFWKNPLNHFRRNPWKIFRNNPKRNLWRNALIYEKKYSRKVF